MSAMRITITVILAAVFASCGPKQAVMAPPAEPAPPRQIALGACGDWIFTVPDGYVVGRADAKDDRMAGINEAVIRARSQVAANLGSKVYQALLDSARLTSTGGTRVARELARHVTDQSVSLAYPVAYYGVWKDNLETWNVLVRFTPNSRLQSLRDQRGLLGATAAREGLDEQEQTVLAQLLDRIDREISSMTGPFASGTAEPPVYDPHNCRRRGIVHLPDVNFEGHPDSTIMWTHPQPSNYRYFLGISDKMANHHPGTASTEAVRRARSQVAAFLKSSIEEDFRSSYSGESTTVEAESGARALRGSLLQEVASTVDNIRVDYAWDEDFAYTHHFRSTILLRFDYNAWLLNKLRLEYERLLAQLAEADPATEAARQLERRVQHAERMIDRLEAGQAGRDAIRD